MLRFPSRSLNVLLLVTVQTTLMAGAAHAQPTFTKSFSPDTIGPGSASTLRFDIVNGSGAPVTDLAFTDVLPAGVSIASAPQAATTCGVASTLTAPAGGGTITFTGGQVGGFGSCFVRVDVTSAVVGTHMNVSGDLTSGAGNSGPATADLTVATDRPGFSKSFAPATVPRGTRSTLTFTIDNTANASAATALSFTDVLPAGMVVADPASASTDCGTAPISPTLTANPGSGQASLSYTGNAAFPAVAAGGTCTVTLDVVPNGAGALENTSGGLSATVSGASRDSGKASAVLTATVTSLHLRKEFLGDPVPPGGTVDLLFRITNFDRNLDATGISFTDNLDAVLTGLAPAGALPADPCGVGSALSFSGGVVSLAGGSLGPGGICSFTIPLAVPAGADPLGSPYSNTTSAVSGTVGGSPVTGNVGSDLLFLSVAPILTKEFTDDPVIPGATATLEFTITSSTTDFDTTNIAFTDDLGAALPGMTATVLPSNGFCGGSSTIVFLAGVLTVNGASLAPAGMAGDSCTFQVTVQVPVGTPGGTYTNTTSDVSADVGDAGAQTGAAATDDLDVVAGPQLSKVFTDDPVQPGDTVTLEFTIEHDLEVPGDATNIAFTDDLSATLAGLTAVGLPMMDICGPGSQIGGTSLLSFSGGTLTPGESCTFSVTLQVPAGAALGTFPNTTSDVSATVLGLATTAPPAVDDLTVTSLSLVKEFTDDPVLPGGTVTLEFTVANLSPTSGATSIFFTDNLSATLSGLAATGLPMNDVCGMGSQISGTTTLIFTGGNLAPGGSCTFSVTLAVPAGATTGSYGNTTQSASAMVDGESVILPNAFDTLQVLEDPLTITKEFTDDPVAPGGTVTLELTLQNLATEAATGIAFTDDLDAALTGLQAIGATTNTCNGMGGGFPASTFSYSGGSLAAGSSCTVVLTLQVPAGAAAGSHVNTTSTVTGTIGGLAVTGPAASDTLEISAGEIAKAFSGPAVAGGTVDLTFTLTNLDAGSSLSGLSFTDDLDAVLSGLVATGLPMSDVCGAGSTISGTGLLTFASGSLGPASSCMVTVTLQLPAGAMPGTYPNTTSDLYTSGLSIDSPATADLGVEPPPTFGKSFNPAFVGLGQSSTLSFTIDNTASALAASSLAFTDNLPAGVQVAAVPGATTTCGGTVTAVAGSGTIGLVNGTVAAGASCLVQVTVVGSAVGAHLNTTGDLTSSSGNSGTASDTLTVNPQPGFTKSFAPAAIAPGAVSTLTFTIDNTASTVAATSLDFTDNLPASVVVATPANASTTCTGGTLTAVADTNVVSYTGGTVAASSSCTVSVDVTSVVVGTHTNTTGNLTSSLGISGSATADLTVPAAPGFAKSFAPSTIDPGGTSTLTFTIDNTGSSVAATSLDFTDNLPASVLVAAPGNAATTCTGGTLTAADGSGVVSYTGGTVAAGASCTVTVNVTSSTVGTHANTTGDLTSSLGNSGPAADDLTVDRRLVFTKDFVPTDIHLLEVTTVVLTLDNSAAAIDATGVSVTDDLPFGLEVANPANASTSAGCVGGSLTANPGGGAFTYAGGTIPAGAVCTIMVDVLAKDFGTLVNTTGDLTTSFGNSGPASAPLQVEGSELEIPTLDRVALLLLALLLLIPAWWMIRR